MNKAIGVVVLFAVAYGLGWLRSLYYFKAFGVGLGLLDLSWRDLMLESWLVLQNVLFFVVLWWIVLRARLVWAGLVALLHALIPIASHYAFALDGWRAAGWLIDYRHTLLKLIPFTVLAAVWWLHRDRRVALRDLSWPHGRAALALFGVVTLAWAVSTAKHSGSFDANLALRSPDVHLSRVELGPAGVAAPVHGDGNLYLLYADRQVLVVWDRSGFVFGSSRELRVLTLRRRDVEWFEARTIFRVQPGDMYL